MPYSDYGDILPAHHFPSRGERYHEDQDDDFLEYKDGRNRGVLAQLVELRELERRGSDASSLRSSSSMSSVGHPGLKRLDSLASEGDEYLEPDDPHVTGKKPHYQECDPQAMAREIMRVMDYKQRRKEKARVLIEFNITCAVSSYFYFIVRLTCSLVKR
jgi:hypothetical protein